MVRSIFSEPEPPAVYAELVSTLLTVTRPAIILALLFLGIGIFVSVTLQDEVSALLTLGGAMATIPRVVVLRLYRRAGPHDADTAGTWERRYTLSTILFLAFISALALRMFAIADAGLQLLTTSLLFGYCSGIVARLSVRPLVAVLTLSVLAIPSVIATARMEGAEYHMLSGLMLIFLLASFESVRHAYHAARTHITVAQEMAAMARNDALTGLLNRFGLRQAFTRIDRLGGGIPMLAVHYFDLDRFKPVNDRLGHPAGDALLCQLAGRLQATLRATDLAARLGGDEFVVVQYPVDRPEDVAAFAERLNRVFDTPFAIAGATVSVGASLGSAVGSGRPDLDCLMAEADRALYMVKQATHSAAA